MQKYLIALFTLLLAPMAQAMYFDQETGLYYNINRTYNPTEGRYLEADPIGQAGGPNLYIYALDNPLKYTDPDGLQVMPMPPIPIPGVPRPGQARPERVDPTDPRSPTYTPGWKLPTFTWSQSSTKEDLEKCYQECDDQLDRDYEYCKALGSTYKDSRTRRACEERAFNKYIDCRKACKDSCK